MFLIFFFLTTVTLNFTLGDDCKDENIDYHLEIPFDYNKRQPEVRKYITSNIETFI